MVMKHGEIVEFDTPLALLDNPKSKFSLMLSQTGDVDPVALRQLALKKEKARESGNSPAMFRTASKSSAVTPIPHSLGHLFPGASLNSVKSFSNPEEGMTGDTSPRPPTIVMVPPSPFGEMPALPSPPH